jgi:hypothetical protein
MGNGVLTLQTPEMIGGGSLRKAIGIARWDVQGIQNTKAVFEVSHLPLQGAAHLLRQIPQRSSKTMAPTLLAVEQMQGLEGLLSRLMAGEASPLVVPRIRTKPGLRKIRLGLM